MKNYSGYIPGTYGIYPLFVDYYPYVNEKTFSISY